MRAFAAALLLALLVGNARAHNGEYHAPLPPPRIEPAPPRPGEPERPGTRTPSERPAVTPGPAGDPGNLPIPAPPPAPPPPAPGMNRQDDRLTVRIWWEENRYRFLPKTADLPHRGELVKVLIEAVGAPAGRGRDEALLALGKTRDPAAWPVLEAAAREENPGYALLALGLSGDEKGAGRLREVVMDGGAKVHERAFAALALGILGREEDRRFVREVANEEWDPTVRTGAVLAMGLLGDREGLHVLGRILFDIHPLHSPEPTGLESEPTLTGLRCAAAVALGRLLVPKAYDYLVWALDRGPPTVAANAATVLAASPGSAGVPALLRAVSPGRPLPVRQAALVGLAARRSPTAAGLARAALANAPDRAGPLGPFAVLSLGLAGDPADAEALLAILENREETAEMRAAAAFAIAVLGDASTAERLETVLRAEKNPEVMGPELIADARIGGPEALELCRKTLTDCELPTPRRDAMTALRILGAPEAVPLLVTGLADSYYVNREAVAALARADARRAATELLSKLDATESDADRFAAHALGELLAPDRPGRLARLNSVWTPLSGAPLLRFTVYLENEYLATLIRNF